MLQGVAHVWGRADWAQRRIERGLEPTLDPGGVRCECVTPMHAWDLFRVRVCVSVCPQMLRVTVLSGGHQIRGSCFLEVVPCLASVSGLRAD